MLNLYRAGQLRTGFPLSLSSALVDFYNTSVIYYLGSVEVLHSWTHACCLISMRNLMHSHECVFVIVKIMVCFYVICNVQSVLGLLTLKCTHVYSKSCFVAKSLTL